MMWTAIKSRLTGQSCVFLSITTVMLRTLHEPSLCLLWEGWAPAGSCYVFACRSQWVPQHSVQEAKLADWLGCTPPTPPLSHLLFPPPLCLFLRRGAHVPSLLSIFFFYPALLDHTHGTMQTWQKVHTWHKRNLNLLCPWCLMSVDFVWIRPFFWLFTAVSDVSLI